MNLDDWHTSCWVSPTFVGRSGRLCSDAVPESTFLSCDNTASFVPHLATSALGSAASPSSLPSPSLTDKGPFTSFFEGYADDEVDNAQLQWAQQEEQQGSRQHSGGDKSSALGSSAFTEFSTRDDGRLCEFDAFDGGVAGIHCDGSVRDHRCEDGGWFDVCLGPRAAPLQQADDVRGGDARCHDTLAMPSSAIAAAMLVPATALSTADSVVKMEECKVAASASRKRQRRAARDCAAASGAASDQVTASTPAATVAPAKPRGSCSRKRKPRAKPDPKAKRRRAAKSKSTSVPKRVGALAKAQHSDRECRRRARIREAVVHVGKILGAKKRDKASVICAATQQVRSLNEELQAALKDNPLSADHITALQTFPVVRSLPKTVLGVLERVVEASSSSS